MIFYLDASVVVPMFIAEATTDAVLKWLETVTVDLAIGRLAAGEVASAVSRRRRRNELTASQGIDALELFDAWARQTLTLIDHISSDFVDAAVLVRRPLPKLLMPDAIHLATCRRLDLDLVTNDDGLTEAADMAGVRWIRPGR